MFLLVKYANFTREDVRNMPILERKFHLDKLLEYTTAENGQKNE